jgi:hypothetical protein
MVPSMLELIFFYTLQKIIQGYDSHFLCARVTVSTKNADPRGCEGRQNALFVRADRFVLRAGSALVQSEQDLAALPIFRGVGLQSIEPQKSNRLFVFQKKFKKGLNSQKRRLRPAKFVQL